MVREDCCEGDGQGSQTFYKGETVLHPVVCAQDLHANWVMNTPD